MVEHLDTANAHRDRIVPEGRVFGGDDDVAGPDQHQAARNALALNLSNGRLGKVPPPLAKANIDLLLTGHLGFSACTAKAAPGSDGLKLRHGLQRALFAQVVAG